MKKSIFILILLYLISYYDSFAQKKEIYTFYIRVTQEEIKIPFTKGKNGLIYRGNDKTLTDIFLQTSVLVFQKAFPSSRRSRLKRTYSVKTYDEKLMGELLKKAPEIFEYGRFYQDEEILLSVPNDYSGGGGLNVDLSYLDFLDMPAAWDYSIGNLNISIGMSDAIVDSTDAEFSDKIMMIPPFRTDYLWHGSYTTAIAAANGNNNYGIPGICYDCSIIHARTNYDAILALSYAGAKVINCSWGSFSTYNPDHQAAIYEAYENGTIIVASSHNRPWSETGGTEYSYPSSYDKVISVTAVGHKLDSPFDDLQQENNGWYYAFNVKNHIGRSVAFEDNDLSKENFVWPVSTKTLNDAVDIAAPGYDTFNYGKYIIDGSIFYGSGTSASAPLVTGTIGLMLDINPCLTFEEIESVLKLSSSNIDDIPANEPFYGKYGSGSLNTGKAVKMVHDMITSGETVMVENQDFYRWDFILESAPENILMQNQTFRDSANAIFKAKEKIELSNGTTLLPGSGGVELIIDPSLSSTCASEDDRPANISKRESNASKDYNYLKVYPNPSEGDLNIFYKNFTTKNPSYITVYDLYGREMYKDKLVSSHQKINLTHLSSGIYLLKLSDGEYSETKKIIIN